MSLTIQPLPTAILLSTSGSGQYNLGDSVTINAKLVNFNNYESLDSLGAAPTGTITLSDQLGTSTTRTTLATLPVTGTAGTSTALATGGATYTTTTLGAGTHVIYATYSGDANYSVNQNQPDTFVNINGATAP